MRKVFEIPSSQKLTKQRVNFLGKSSLKTLLHVTTNLTGINLFWKKFKYLWTFVPPCAELIWFSTKVLRRIRNYSPLRSATPKRKNETMESAFNYKTSPANSPISILDCFARETAARRVIKASSSIKDVW